LAHYEEAGLGKRSVRFVTLLALALLLDVSTVGAWPVGVDHSIFSEEPITLSDDPPVEPLIGGVGDGPDERNESRARTIVGASLLGSGIFLCSWGITSWEVEEYQCCPARNTGNVVKIVAGVVLINAGLIYLLEVMD
jgi:hypothetical protein